MVHVWDMASGKETRRLTLDGPGGSLGSAAFSPDGRWLAWSYQDASAPERLFRLRVWDLATGTIAREFSKPDQHLTAPTFSPDGRCLVAFTTQGEIVRWELATGKERRPLLGHRANWGTHFPALAFSADGTLLASGSSDTVGYLWDLGTRLHPPKGPLSAKELEAHWAALLGDDAVRAEQAILALAAQPQQSLPLLADRLRPAAAADPAAVERLLAALDSERFAAREQATADLEKLGEPALPALRAALAAQPGAETRRRLDAVREKVEKTALMPAGERLREARALEVLERVGSPATRAILDALTKGLPEVTLTRDAKASFERLERRAATSP